MLILPHPDISYQIGKLQKGWDSLNRQ